MARLAALIVVVVLFPAAAAQATTYCVNTTGSDCDVPEGSSFQQALDDAKTHTGPDAIRLGSAALTTPGGFTYNTPVQGNTVAIIGAGGRAFGQSRTSMSDTNATASGDVVLKVISPQPSTISGIGVVVPAGVSNEGIDTNGTVSDVAVQGTSPVTGVQIGIGLEAGASLTDGDVSVPTANSNEIGVLIAGANTRVDGSTIQAGLGVDTPTGAGGPVSTVVHRSEIVSSVAGLELDAGTFLVEDSLLRNTTDGGTSHDGVHVAAPNVDTTVTLNHVTMVGASDAGTALKVTGSSSHTAAATLRNSVVAGYSATLARSATGAGAANITTDYSDYTGPTSADTGPGSITATNHLTAAPGFVGVSDFHLRSDSPLVDAGDPAALGSGESATDLSGQPRITDGNDDCSARRDVGAYEFQPGQRPPHAVATVTPGGLVVGTVASFDASASCDSDGDALSYAWTFDDGATATGATVSHSFATSGTHVGTVTVTDSTGRAATATASAFVAEPSPPPPPPKFLGVKIAKQTVRVSKRGVALVKVKCLATAATGPCAGRLKLLGRKASFKVATGKTKKVAVKLSKPTLKALRKKHRLKTTATATAHDAKGASKTTHGKVTLLTPR